MTNFANKNNDSDDARADYPALSDNQLLSLIGIDRDPVALTELYNRYNATIGRFLQRQTCDAKLVDEIYNDVMLTVWNKAAGFRGDSKVSTWIFGIAYRIRLTHSRKENRHRHSGTDELMANIESDGAVGAEAQASINEALHAALIQLSEPHRAVIELAYFHGYSTAEISDIVRCPQNTVKTRLFHARKKLKETLEAERTAPITAPIDRGQNSDRQLNGFFPKHVMVPAI